MRTKRNQIIQGAPVDLLGISRYQLGVYLCSLRRDAQRAILEELKSLEDNHEREGARK